MSKMSSKIMLEYHFHFLILKDTRMRVRNWV